jgi:formate dehydrogenase gamma subunit
MSRKNQHSIHTVRLFPRFSLSQRWEHMILLLSFAVLLLTGLPQKYRAEAWSQVLLSTPERVALIQQIHHIAAIFLTLEVVYHLAKIGVKMVRRKLSADMLIGRQDLKDALHTLKYLLFLSKDQPRFGKFNFEQKVTYWFFFFALGIMVLTGFALWFPIQVTQVLPGGVIPAAKMAHSTEAVVAGLFVVIWHFYHVHIERLNLSIFTGRLNENDTKKYHNLEYQRQMRGTPAHTPGGKK